MKKTKQKGQHKLVILLLLALMVLIVAFGFVYAYKYTDLFNTTKSEKILATPSGNEEVNQESEGAGDENNTENAEDLNTVENQGESEMDTSTESSINTSGDDQENSSSSKAILTENTISGQADNKVVKPSKESVPVKTTEEIVLEKADEILEEIAEKPDYIVKDLCTTPATPTESGKIVFPIDEKYSKLTFLGQVFTAAKCGDERLFSIWGISGETYTLGNSLSLNKSPSPELLKALNDIGYECSDESAEGDCKTWNLSKEIKVKSLVILEPFIEYMASDDCYLCG